MALLIKSPQLTNPFRLWTAALLILAAAALLTNGLLIYTARQLQSDSLDSRLATLMAAGNQKLARHDFRGFVESTGRNFSSLYVEVSFGKTVWSVGSNQWLSICNSRNLDNIASHSMVVKLCEPELLPLTSASIVIGFFLILSLTMWPAASAMERGAVKSLGALFSRFGAPLRAHSFRDILERLDEISQDLSRAKKQELDLAQTRAVAETVQMLAHDLRRPFSQMRLGLTKFQSEMPRDRQTPVLEFKQRVESCFDEVEGMLEDLMTNTNQPLALHKVDWDLAGLLKHQLSAAHTRAADQSISAEFDGPSVLCGQLDPRRLSRVFANILDNAFQATPQSGRVWVKLLGSPNGEGQVHAVIEIGNSGSFIPADVIEQIFQPFFTQGKHQGTGLGLAIVKKVVDGHQGEILCRSDLRDGTRFILTLPLLTAKASELVDPDTAPPEGGKVLILDDDPYILDAWEDRLGKTNTICVEKLQQADRLFDLSDGSRELPTVWAVILDRYLENHQNGLAWAKRARLLFPDSRILVSSDDTSLRLPIEGVDLLIPKQPMSVIELWQMCQRI